MLEPLELKKKNLLHTQKKSHFNIAVFKTLRRPVAFTTQSQLFSGLFLPHTYNILLSRNLEHLPEIYSIVHKS